MEEKVLNLSNRKEYQREYARKRRGDVLYQDYAKKYRESHKQKMKEYKTSADQRYKSREYKLKKRYGVTVEEYNKLFDRQGGLCAICKTPASKKKKWLSVDHSHTTGEVRGLLCNDCNIALGRMNDNIEFLKNAIAYLYGGKSTENLPNS